MSKFFQKGDDTKEAIYYPNGHQENLDFPQFQFTPSPSFQPSQIVRKNVISVDYLSDESKENADIVDVSNLIGENDCITLYNVFTEEECQQFIQQGEDFGFEKLSAEYSETYRNNERILLQCQSFVDIWWDRVRPFVEDELEIGVSHPTLHTNYFTQGKWQKDSLNPLLRLCKYQPGNFFKPHYDNGTHKLPRENRCFKTCMLYLNESFEGGETIFHVNYKKYVLKPKPGMCLIFNQKIRHEGATVSSGLKYMIRTDLNYQLIQRDAGDYESSLGENEKKALDLYTEGVEKEEFRLVDEAIKCYKLAEKMYSDVAALYNSYFS